MWSPATGPSGLGGLVHVARRDVAAAYRHVRRDPRHLAREVLHQVEQVDAQVHHVLAPAAVVVLAVGVQLQQPADAPPVKQPLEAIYTGQIGAVEVAPPRS